MSAAVNYHEVALFGIAVLRIEDFRENDPALLRLGLGHRSLRGREILVFFIPPLRRLVLGGEFAKLVIVKAPLCPTSLPGVCFPEPALWPFRDVLL